MEGEGINVLAGAGRFLAGREYYVRIAQKGTDTTVGEHGNNAFLVARNV